MFDELLPLFPLPVVLFPTSVLPLHIFEERYKQLIGECLTDRKEFGVNLLYDGKMVKVGCSAVVTKLVKRYEDGKMDVLVRGQRRYELGELVDTSSPYNVGRIKLLQSKDEIVITSLAAETVRLHNDLVHFLYKNKRFEIVYDGQNPEISFTIALKAGMELAERQRVLEMDSENERLRFLHQYLTEAVLRVGKQGEAERLIKNDGYIIN